MKKLLPVLFCCSLLFSVSCFAQTVKYTTHTIAKGETLSMLAKKYHTTVGDIMRLNGMHADSKLSIGQKIKIPTTATVAKKTDTTVTKKTVVVKPPTAKQSAALIHVVQAKETLYGISKKYKVSLETIKKLNNLKSDNLEVGQELALNTEGANAIAAKKTQLVAKPTQLSTVDNPPLVTNPVFTKEETKPDTIKQEIALQKNENTDANKIDITTSVATQTQENNQMPVMNSINTQKDGSDNFFTAAYSTEGAGKMVESVTGTSMIFKTASGWSDKKFYILMNEAPAGSVVKITSSNGNVVYAKVLWGLDKMKENNGLNFRISEATAAALGITDAKFQLTVNYHQ